MKETERKSKKTKKKYFENEAKCIQLKEEGKDRCKLLIVRPPKKRKIERRKNKTNSGTKKRETNEQTRKSKQTKQEPIVQQPSMGPKCNYWYLLLIRTLNIAAGTFL